jgi:aspartate/methionine/tyrosine aminotransferase
VRYDLTSSGLPYLALAELPVALEELELSGSGGYGWAPLQQAIAARYRVPVECTVAAMGTSMANHLAMAALLKPGDEVLVEHPTYEPLLAVARYLGARVVRFTRSPERGFALEAAEVERALTPRTRLVVLTNPHNPSSALASDDTLRQIGELASRQGVRVLVDEVYLDARFSEPPATCVHLGEAFVSTSSLTKVYGLNGLRCGWVLADAELAGRLWRLNELFSNIGAHPAERLSVAAFRHLPVIAERSRRILERNTEALNAFYATRPDLVVEPHRLGTVSFPRLREREGDRGPRRLPESRVDTLCARLLERHDTAVVPGRCFELPDHFRIGLGVDPDRFTRGLEHLGAALDSLRA